ncbi:rodlin [Streptomyces sp. NPDC001401]|uniref:rodlin n=1 Tax=Streptomyces sp. NPDC001401 TaxID=3364570 RepID=UPI0036C52F27
MMKKMMVTAVLAVGFLGMAPHAMAIGDEDGTTSVSGTLKKPCLGVPVKANLASIVGLVHLSSLQDVPILSAPQNQQCTENSTQAKGDDPLSHILDQIPVLSGNGEHNG